MQHTQPTSWFVRLMRAVQTSCGSSAAPIASLRVIHSRELTGRHHLSFSSSSSSSGGWYDRR